MLPVLIQQMLRPDFYPSSEATVQLIQTHISYVLLTGEFAYKVKKPLNFGFLNYSTLEARRHFSEEELRLNQPLATQTVGLAPFRAFLTFNCEFHMLPVLKLT